MTPHDHTDARAVHTGSDERERQTAATATDSDRLRRDPVTGAWSIVASERRQRPHGRRADGCPFCAGNEVLTPPEVDAVRAPGSLPDGPGWRVRVVPNRYPAVPGAHEVVVHSPHHDRDLERLGVDDVTAVIEIYARRIAAHLDDGARAVTVVCNRGEEAGASLSHPHSQVLATPIVPDRLLAEAESFLRFRNRYGSCVLCEQMETARREGRIVFDDELVAWMPHATAWPYGAWLAPALHAADLWETDPQAVAVHLRRLLTALLRATGDAPLNFWIHTAPRGVPSGFHWHIETAPRLQKLAGIELGTGMAICEVDPLTAAERLREALD